MVSLETAAVSRTVARDPMLVCFMGISSAPEKNAAGNFMAYQKKKKNVFRDLCASVSKTHEAINSEKTKQSLIRISQTLEHIKGVPIP